VITFSDITDSKMLENKLWKTGMMLRSIVDTNPDLIICLSPEGNILEFNIKAEKTLGRNRQDVIGKNYFSLFVPEARQKKAAAEMAKLIEGSLPGPMETIAKTDDGGECQVEFSVNKLFDEKGIVSRTIAIGRKG
jgi:PAS domain S-box-containing protein